MMPTDNQDLHDLSERIARLTPPERFRLVADLFEAGAFSIALGIARRTVTELEALRALSRPAPSRPTRPDPRERIALPDEET